MPEQVWTHQQFEEMSWHDNHVHGLRIVEGSHGAGELVLDLDFILEWNCGPDGCKFQIVPAALTFLEVTNLRIALDWATTTAALGPFSISGIERSSERRERYVAQIWKILINWPNGEIVFEASGFVQRATGTPVLSNGQCLSADERKHKD